MVIFLQRKRKINNPIINRIRKNQVGCQFAIIPMRYAPNIPANGKEIIFDLKDIMLNLNEIFELTNN